MQKRRTHVADVPTLTAEAAYTLRRKTHPAERDAPRLRSRQEDVVAAAYPFELEDVATTTTTHPRLQACGACMCHRQHALFVPFLWSFSYQVHGEGTTPSQDEPPLICSPPEKRPRRLRPEEHDVTPQRQWMKSEERSVALRHTPMDGEEAAHPLFHVQVQRRERTTHPSSALLIPGAMEVADNASREEGRG